MKDFFSMLWDTGNKEWIDWVSLIFMWIAVVLILGLIIYGLLFLIDYSFRPLQEGIGKIESKVFVPAHTTTTLNYNPATKTSMPITTYHPDSWYLEINVEDRCNTFYVDYEDYLRVKEGKTIPITYTLGRIWHSVYIKAITP